MPIYQYICENNHIKEECQSIKDFDKTKVHICEECQSPMESYFSEPVLGFVHQEASTIGQLGEKNFKKLGKIRGDEMMSKRKEEHDKVRQANGLMSKEDYKKARKLAGLSPEKRKKYIHTGKLQ